MKSNGLESQDSDPFFAVLKGGYLRFLPLPCIITDMAVKVPCTVPEFLGVSGVGEVKAERYGEAFLKAIALYQEKQQR